MMHKTPNGLEFVDSSCFLLIDEFIDPHLGNIFGPLISHPFLTLDGWYSKGYLYQYQTLF